MMRTWLMMAVLLLGAEFASAADINGLRLWRSPDSTRLVFDLSAPLSYKLFSLKSPQRIVIDFENTKIKQGFDALDLSNSPIKGVRSATRAGGGARVVLDLSAAVRSKSFLLKPNKTYGHRLVVDLDDAAKVQVKTVQQVAKSAPRGGRDVVIAIDAGHGGEDPGAIGYKGLKEKHVVLSIARELHALLKKEKGFKPVLVRSGDYYIGLRKRSEKARAANADLFVSIHADAFKNKKANGASVFTLSERRASSEDARWLAKKENQSDLIGGVGGVSLGDKDPMLAGVLLDLSRTASRGASMSVGDRVLQRMGKVTRLHKSHVEQASFSVLRSPDMPSILVETGFITNPKDGKNLASKNHQRKLANSIFSGLKSYFSQTPPPGTYLALRKSGTPVAQHQIRRGDTLSSIATRYKVSVASIRTHNGLSKDVIRIGQTLQIPN